MNNMIKSIKSGKHICLRIKNARTQRRFFLTKAYQCQEAWERRFDSPILRKVKPADLFFELDNKFTNDGKVSAIDVDVFANTIKEEYHTDELLDVLHKLRLTAETTNTLESTHHATVRFLLKHNRIDDLFEVLNDRLNYGIFPDNFCCNILMDKFIQEKNFASAAKVAGLLMLQEDTSHPICNMLSIYSCFKYLENPNDWKAPEKKEDDSTEVIKVRVNYIRNPYFDDHFDLVDPLEIVGKTLAFQGKHMNNLLGRTCWLRGMILYKKYEKTDKLLNEWLVKYDKNIVHEEVLDLIKTDIQLIPEDQRSEHLKNLEKSLNNLKDDQLNKENLIERIGNEIMFTVNICAETDMKQQEEMISKWEKTRQEILEQQQKEIDKQLRLENIKKIKEKLEKEERLLTFFENEEQIELEIERKQDIVRLEDEKLAKKPKAQHKLQKLVAEEHYIPPNI